jgi:hypothetical protein
MSNLVPFQDLQGMAGAIAKSGLFGMKQPDQALALMLVAQAEGMHPATITQDYDIIQGKACRKTHSVMARFQQMGGKVEWHELTDAIADATFSHASGGKLRMSWTIEQAKKAGLTNKDNWRNYPRAMLRARLIAEAIRTVYPAAIGGMMLSEEAQDIDLTDSTIADIRQTRSPASAAAANAPADLSAFEDNHLETMRDAAMSGVDALQAAFVALPAGAQKQAFWAKHGPELKKAAAESVVIDADTGEIA